MSPRFTVLSACYATAFDGADENVEDAILSTADPIADRKLLVWLRNPDGACLYGIFILGRAGATSLSEGFVFSSTGLFSLSSKVSTLYLFSSGRNILLKYSSNYFHRAKP